MRKISIIFIAFTIFATFSCSQKSTNQTDNNLIVVNVKSTNGQTNHVVDGTKNRVVSTKSVDYEVGTTVTQDYSYNLDNEISIIDVHSQIEGNYVISYDNQAINTGRSAQSADNTTDVKVKRITKTKNTGRGVETSDIFVEYYYDKDGNLLGISSIDEKNNIFVKGDTK